MLRYDVLKIVSLLVLGPVVACKRSIVLIRGALRLYVTRCLVPWVVGVGCFES